MVFDDEFQIALARHGVQCSVSRKGNCYDNAVVEAFFATLKRERVCDRHYSAGGTGRHAARRRSPGRMDIITSRMKICQAIRPEHVALSRALFEEYGAWLGIDLSFQGFAAELAGLPGLYAPPRGRLLLALANGEGAGCVALRPLEEAVCEMKRLFVRPAFRGQGLGKLLAERIVEEAHAIGYATMRLDTLPSMQAAIRLYESLGFVYRAPYYDAPLRDTVFMELQL